MFRLSTLTAKLVSVGSVILVLSLVWIGLTLWVTWQLEGGAAAVNEAGRMRMQTWRLASAVQAEQAQAEVQGLVKQFDDSLALLRSGIRPDRFSSRWTMPSSGGWVRWRPCGPTSAACGTGRSAPTSRRYAGLPVTSWGLLMLWCWTSSVTSRA